jgi:dCTP deaminase
MSILCDHEIASLAHGGMISPFIEEQRGDISYGLSSFGYDIRVANRFKVFTNVHSPIVDPKRMEASSFVDVEQNVAVIPPNSFALARTVERFRMPDDVMALCVGKSTYARCGIIVNVTPLEPGWEGVLTLEISNTTPLPVEVYANEGIAQLIFFRGRRPLVTYGDRKGKYQGQTDITLPLPTRGPR